MLWALRGWAGGRSVGPVGQLLEPDRLQLIGHLLLDGRDVDPVPFSLWGGRLCPR
jgi:hypothetical protein